MTSKESDILVGRALADAICEAAMESLMEFEPMPSKEKDVLDTIVGHVQLRGKIGDTATLDMIEDLITNFYEEE